MTAPHFRALCVTTGFFMSLAGLGCTSSDFATAPESDGNVDDAALGDSGNKDSFVDPAETTDATLDSAPLCIVPPTATGSETDFCNFEAHLYSRCGQCESCRQNNVNGCVPFGNALSTSFKSALIACQNVLACGDYTSLANDVCVQEKLTVATPTAAQLDAKNSYCTACPMNTAACAGFFDFSGGDAGPDAGQRGIGAMVMYASDDIAKVIGNECKGFLNCDPTVYQVCAVGKFCGKTAPDDCKTGFCGK